MSEVYVVDALRSPFGRSGGALSSWHPVDLAAHVIRALLERVDMDPGAVEDVHLGCVNQIGPQTSCIARLAWLSAGFPEHVPGVTVDRRCGSSMQAVQSAAQMIMSGTADVVVAGGVESMSIVPIGSPRRAHLPGQETPLPSPFSALHWESRYGPGEPHQLDASDELARQWDLERAEMEEIAAVSHERAAKAWAEGRYGDEVIPLAGLERDEGIRTPVDRSKMSQLEPIRPGGSTTAAMASQVSDGASAVLLASQRGLQRHGLDPLVRVRSMAVAADDPVLMLTAPIAATRKALDRSELTVEDIGLFEVNEAFASVVAVCERELSLDHQKVNVNGGAIAMGHPLGASGARLIATLAHEQKRREVPLGLATMCESGGQANTTILELADSSER